VNASPGLVDLQVNGYAGIDFSSPSLSTDQVIQAARLLREQGTALFCPTVVTAPWSIYTHVLPILAQAEERLKNLSDDYFAQIAGIHLEGPFISPAEGARGVHDASSILPASIPAFDALVSLSSGSVRLLTLAPEVPGALELVRHASEQGILVGLGHTLADASTIHAAVDAGACFSTHLGNGLPSVIHRHNNPIWTQLAEERLVTFVIADGHHLPADLVKVIVAVKSVGGVVVTSDSASPAGLPAGEFSFCGKTVRLDPDGRLSDPQTGYLAGSSANLRQCQDWLGSLGFTRSELTRLCRENALALLANDIQAG
jgi:N-acetylglucosamine-6-phosphate deacetylase